MVRLDARVDMLRDLGAEVVIADMLDIVAVSAAMQGCSVVLEVPDWLSCASPWCLCWIVCNAPMGALSSLHER